MSDWLPSVCSRCCISVEKLHDDREAEIAPSGNTLPLVPRLLPWPKHCLAQGTWSLIFRVFYTLIFLPFFATLAYLRLQPTSSFDQTKGNLKSYGPGGWKIIRENDLRWYWILLLLAWAFSILGLPFLVAFGLESTSDGKAGSDGYVWLWFCILIIPLLVIGAYRSRSISMPLAVVWRGRGRTGLWIPLLTMSGWRNLVAGLGLILEMLQLSALAFANHGDRNPFWVLLFDWDGTFTPMFYVCLAAVYTWHCVLSFVIALSAGIAHPGESVPKRIKDNVTLNVQHLPFVNFIHPVISELSLVTIVYHLFRALACTKPATQNATLVLVADPQITCWVGQHQAQGAVAMLALSLFAPFSILLSPLLRADSSLHSLVRLQTSKNGERRPSWTKSNEPEHPELQLRPAFSALDRTIKFILIAFAVLLRGDVAAIPVIFFILLFVRIVLSRLLPADQEAIHIHRGPCYFAAMNHPILYSYVAAFLSNPVSAITFWLGWNEAWHKIVFMAATWIMLALAFWWANYSYFRGADEKTLVRGNAREMELRPEEDIGFMKSESIEQLEAPEVVLGSMAGAVMDSGGSGVQLVSDAPSSTSFQTRPSPSMCSAVSKQRRSQSNEKSESSSSNKSHGPAAANRCTTPVRKKEGAWEEEKQPTTPGRSFPAISAEPFRISGNSLASVSPKRIGPEVTCEEPEDRIHLSGVPGNKAAVTVEVEPVVRKDNPLASLPHIVTTSSTHDFIAALTEPEVLASKAELITAEDLNAVSKVHVQLQDSLQKEWLPAKSQEALPLEQQDLDHMRLVQLQQQMMLEQLQQQEQRISQPPVPQPHPIQPQLQYSPHHQVHHPYHAEPLAPPQAPVSSQYHFPAPAGYSAQAVVQRTPPRGVYPPQLHPHHQLQHQLQDEYYGTSPPPFGSPYGYNAPHVSYDGFEVPIQPPYSARQLVPIQPIQPIQPVQHPEVYQHAVQIDGNMGYHDDMVDEGHADDHDRKSAEGNYWNANEDEEDQNEYRPGGYHPVYIGEVFNNSFRVFKKLGWGEFSTVWLAWDIVSHQFVALKVSKSSPDYRKSSMWEVEVFERINEILKGTPNEHSQRGMNKEGHKCLESQCVVRMYDSFDHRGPNGSHLVMVFEVLGPNLLSLISAHDFKGIPINIVKSITRQVLKGLSFIHDQVKIIHTDLKPENILMNRPSEDVATAIADYLNQIKRETNENYDFLLPLKEKDLSGLSYPERLAYEYGITISDLGAARWLSKEYPPAVIQTREYRSPEVILGVPRVGTAIDIWSMACIVFELITGDFLFDPKSEKTIDKDVYHLALFMQILGDIPKSIALGPGRNCPKFFNKRGEFRHKCKLQPCQLNAVFHHNYGLPEEEANELASFLLPMLEYHPAKRITAREALKHPWLNIREPP